MTQITRRPTGFGTGPGNLIEKWLNAYDEGDVNNPEKLNEWRNGAYGWVNKAPKAGPYLNHIRSLVQEWPHLQLLADFMEVGTTPVRWNPKVPGGLPADEKLREEERSRRMAKTKVTLLEYPDNGGLPKKKEFTDSATLDDHIAGLENEDDPSVRFRLFVVEDLSRDVIETLGSRYDVDPSFFREHIVDYVWYNIKDWWRDPPNLDIVARSDNWFQVRFCRARYFDNEEAYLDGEREASKFNVYRQLQRDFNHSRLWDVTKGKEGMATKKQEARIGHIRSRATYWMKTPEKPTQSRDRTSNHTDTTAVDPDKRQPVVGILLLDPTVKTGHPVWRQYRNWNRPPSMNSKTTKAPAPPGPQKGSNFFEDFIYWATHPEAFNFNPNKCKEHEQSGASSEEPSPVCIPTQALLHMICNEWLTLVDYIKTRLNQVDWEIAFPDNFLAKDEQIEKALTKLHYWRRLVPVYREMLGETFLRVFRETKHPDRMDFISRGGGSGDYNGPTDGGHHDHNSPASVLDTLMDRECINAYKQDYKLVLNALEEYQARIDRLTEVVTAVISIQDSRRGYKDNKNLQWLTWLATFFIPLSFVATMLSMTTDPIWQLRDATILWAEVSIPSGLVILSFVLLMSIARCRRAIRRFFIQFPWMGKWRPFQQRRS